MNRRQGVVETILVLVGLLSVNSIPVPNVVEPADSRAAEERLFLDAYSGLFHNQEQAMESSGKLQFASKFHTPIRLPGFHGENVFYIHEKTNRGGAMTYRLRVASISRIQEVDGVVFVAEHYQFANQTSLESLPEESAAKLVEKMDASQLTRLEGGAVQFKKRPGEDVWQVETKYDSCKDSSSESMSTKTHISGTLSRKGWFVKAVMTRPDGSVVFQTELDLNRAPTVPVPSSGMA